MKLDRADDEKILKSIDFVNHHYGGSAKVNDVFFCEHCNKNFPQGKFRYDKGGYVPGPDVMDLHVMSADFPLSDLHTFRMLNYSDESHYGSSDILFNLFSQSRDWNYFDIPEHCFNEYEKVMRTSSLLQMASLESNHWYYAVRSTPIYTEEEMSQDPIKREIMETENAINKKPKLLENAVKHEIDFLFKEIIGDNDVPIIYVIPEEFQSDIGDTYYKLSFIENTYNTFKAKNIFSPNKERSSLIEKINSYFNEVELKYKKNPSMF